jgi:hypothetical protein
MRAVVAGTGTLADVPGQRVYRRAIDEHLVRAIGPHPFSGAVLKPKSLHAQFPAVAFDIRHRGSPS